MSENLRNYTRAVYTVDAVVNRMPPQAWDRPSPCEGWTAREVLGHFMWGMQSITSAAHGGDRPAVRSEAEVATDEPTVAWAATRDELLAALDHQGALQRTFTGPFGPSTIDAFLAVHTLDGILHAWDIARAGGIEACVPVDLALAGTAAIEGLGDVVRQPGLFGPAVDCPADADPVSRFVAVAGRRP
jgi:uncharacterized protein (TIGR03086 family)